MAEAGRPPRSITGSARPMASSSRTGSSGRAAMQGIARSWTCSTKARALRSCSPREAGPSRPKCSPRSS
eukprot:6474791-Lingulodinium_polyedra.AAC.1